MAIPLYTDQHVPRAITTELRLRGVDVLTAQEDGADTPRVATICIASRQCGVPKGKAPRWMRRQVMEF